ncbi:putative transcriptional acitvator, Baf family [Gloeothece citriformis PCC 7424]|uniref:Type III pantothenate kinase n=1 Tax=Gloeothece citriformis (strain PCC 7424) TaxID=65393 RepID=B7KLG8_GLOC7|nr:pantothenate kinase [Gloeothece citriformis]ACK72540.1 putative transcriptional acitvator, Baf family [Gloeothece citriformis PCC 7424]
MMNELSFRWLGLMIGNSRLHWAKFEGKTLEGTWDSEHAQIDFSILENLPLCIASVVPTQTEIWQRYPLATLITLQDIPLKGLYSTLGIDRALALWGAGQTYGFPCLVIDGGTALTFTAGTSDRTLIGGAILPGLRLQLQSLETKTGALPQVSLPDRLPPRWAINTPEAIQSGVIYSLLAGLTDFITHWWTLFPDAQVVMTGGDGQLLHRYLSSEYPEIAQKIRVASELIFWGMREIKLLDA